MAHRPILAFFSKKQSPDKTVRAFTGADDEARTRYLHLGKVALYQMSYVRGTFAIISKIQRNVNT